MMKVGFGAETISMLVILKVTSYWLSLGCFGEADTHIFEKSPLGPQRRQRPSLPRSGSP